MPRVPSGPIPPEEAPTGPPPPPDRRKRDAAVVAAFAVGTMVVVALVLRFSLGSADARRAALGPLQALPAPPAGQCAVAADGRVLGRVVGVLGRGGKPAAYRVEEYPGHGVAPSASTLAVPVEGTRLVRCADVPAKPAGS
jgi:hypothetical protein